MRGLVWLRYALIAGALLLVPTAFGQESGDVGQVAEQAGQSSPAVDAAQDSAAADAQSPAEGKQSAAAAWLIWVFSPLSWALPAIAWWLLLGLLLLWDGFLLSRNAALAFTFPFEDDLRDLQQQQDQQQEAAIFLFIQGSIMIFGLSWLGVVNPAAILLGDWKQALTYVGIHLVVGVAYSISCGLWDIHFKYYRRNLVLAREAAQRVRSVELAANKERFGAAFNPQDPEILAAVSQAIEEDLLFRRYTQKLYPKKYIGYYVFIGLFWEPVFLWRWGFQYLESWWDIMANFAQYLADYYHKKLKAAALLDE